jgi:hypothetical protein
MDRLGPKGEVVMQRGRRRGRVTPTDIRREACQNVLRCLSAPVEYRLSDRALRNVLDREIWTYSEAERGGPSYKSPAHCLLTSTGVEANPKAKLTFEHVVPKRVVIDFLLSLFPTELSLERVETIMARLTVGCLVTRDEDGRLNDAGLKEAMPIGWSAVTGNPWDRYAQAGLRVVFRPGSDVLPGNHLALALEAGVI